MRSIISAVTGVLGVTFDKKRRLMRRVVVNADGKRTYKHQSLVDEAGQAEQAASFKRRAFSATHVEPGTEVGADHPHDDAVQPNENNAEDPSQLAIPSEDDEDHAAVASSRHAASNADPKVAPTHIRISNAWASVFNKEDNQ